MPRISVVVPIYNVEPYLRTCLDSLARQTFDDIEVVMVEDGSTDRSAAIAQEFAGRDARFRLLRQPNGGLGKARNAGIDAATGEFLAFVDSDDYLADNAYELLLGALDETGSDFASGNVLRATTIGIRPVFFLEQAFAETRLKTHVSRYPQLIADRVAWNKLWRRSFWTAQGLRFPEGVLNEDIPVTVPAHFAARSVDVLSDVIYYWRMRGGEELSITQRRLEPGALLDRMAAIEQVTEHLERHGKRRWRRWYQRSVVSDDLRFYLNLLDEADDDYRELFFDKVNEYVDRAGDKILDRLPAIERLKWHLVRRRLGPELVETLGFQREQLRETPPVCIRGRWYGDYPFRTDERLKVPRSVYRLEGELYMQAGIDAVEWDGRRIQVRGHAFISGIGAPTPDTQRIKATMLRSGRLRRVRLLFAGARMHTTTVRRPDVTASARQPLADLEWSGFEATLDPRRLLRAARLREGVWELYVTLRAGKVKRRRARFALNAVRPIRGLELSAPHGLAAKAVSTDGSGISFEARKRWERATRHRVDGGVLELSGEARGPKGGRPRLETVKRGDGATSRHRMTLEGDRFSARLKLSDVAPTLEPEPEDPDRPAATPALGDRVVSEIHVVGNGPRRPLLLSEDAAGAVSELQGRAVVLARSRAADAALIAQRPRPVVESAQWTGDGSLDLSGELPPASGYDEVVLSAREYTEEHAFSLGGDLAGGRFEVTLEPAAVETLAGRLPLGAGRWELHVRSPGGSWPAVPVDLAPGLYDELPLETVVAHKPFALGQGADGRATLVVDRDLDEDERGGYHQRRLRDTAYEARRGARLRDAVLYASFRGRQYSDSPRAIHEELVRRDAPFEHLWVVRDGMCRVPDTAQAVREGSREYFEAYATARYVVSNDHFPDWFSRRPDQLCVQTWHGTPLKRLGLDVADRRNANRFARWEQQVPNWQYVLSPNRFSTQILRRAYAIEGEMLETGYPRNDMLARPDRDVLTRALRRRLGVPEDARVVLYAPTYRDQMVDRRGRYRLDLQLDLQRLRDAVGDDTVILFRKHHYVVDAVPVGADGFVRDVSAYPDGNELLLAADLLVTDYSSMMFDFANTGRPMLFFAYDLDVYADDVRGLYLDYVDTVPGPILRTTDEVIDALRDLDGVRAAYAQRYESFAANFCELDDGHASERVVDRLFPAW